MLPPLLQLEIDELPHHPRLCETDGSQAAEPDSQDIEVSISDGEPLVFRTGQAEAKGEDREGEGEEASDDEEQCPQRKPFLLILIAEVEEPRRVEQQLHQVVRHQQDEAQTVKV